MQKFRIFAVLKREMALVAVCTKESGIGSEPGATALFRVVSLALNV